MQILTRFKKSIHIQKKIKIDLIRETQVKCQQIGPVFISRAMGKDDSYVTNTLFKRSGISDDTLIAIAETVKMYPGGKE